MRIFRPSVSPPRLSMRQNDRPEPRSHTWTLPSANADYNEVIGTNPNDFPVPKRSRLPFPPSSYPSFHVNNSSGHDDTERELQAKAKRLARFKDELSQTESSDFGNRNQKAQQLEQSVAHKRKFIGEASDVAGAMRGSNLSSDHEDHNSSTVIIGTCTDMCPEQERAERERKGDLDQYERLDGDRNQTSTSLAIKKYTRTAEREAALIRPMPILQKTMDYLLNLLDQPYDDKLLGIYNFLWDRMRAIRMDLRMQHIFNLGAITMLEQMIRLHIIAMHELCQYTKGEGFSEGFDAHLNIEQMNKTSVELFQLYDDHRKKEIFVPSEKEFRGYYALLKLDKHPGYKVEPAELSLDLAKMTPEIRQAAEVLFARDVARACRTGNFIAFFRLAKKASYLQACLMHAHFGKLRTQALASLHSGLQNNQGVPVTQVALWLGMEEENIEHLLEYHGFFIKEFEEPYMVKEGPFLNADHDYPLKCSKLVHMKRSSKVVEDVSSSLIEPLTPENLKELQVDKANMREVSPVIYKETQRPAGAIDSDMADYVTVSSAKDDIQVKSMSNILLANGWNEDHHWMELVSSAPGDIFKTDTPFGSLEVINTDVGKPSYNTKFRNSLEKNGQSNACAVPPQDMQKNILTEKSSGLEMDSSVEDSMAQPVSVDDLQLKEPINMLQEVGNDEVDTTLIDEEVAQAKLKLILRIWRKRSLKKKDLREQRRLAANAALSSLSLGPPMWQCEREHQASDEFNIDHAMSQRYEKQGRSWSTLNVSSLIAAKLGERNQYPRCICWKLILCSSRNPDGDMLERGRTISYLDPLPWLRCKLMPDDVSSNDDLLVSLPGLSIWKNWICGKSISDLTCCLSVVREMQSDNLVEATVAGTSAVMFILSEGMPWEVQKICLYDLLSTIPSGSSLPLLIVSASYENPSDPYTTVKNLGLDDIDKTRICSFSVISLVKNDQLNRVDGFFVDEQLKKGLEWLASESPLQPAVRCVKTRESVLTHLNNALDVHEQLNPYKVNPEHCVLAINGALDQTIEEIGKAAKSNPICWPCPEISLLSQSSDERKTTELYLPSIGWSSSTRIEPLIHALGDCKLPNILKDTSWWCKNSDLGIDIQKQRQELEDYLVKYLTCLMGLHLARKEASVMLQNCVGLELHGSSHYIVPNWLMIFQRVFNWQVMNLSNGTFATAYVLEEKQQQHNASIIIPGVMGKLGSKAIVYESRNLISPSLDEMLEVCCSSNLDYQGFRPLVQTVADTLDVQMVPSADDSMREERNIEQHGKRAEVNGSTATETSIGTGDALVVESKNVKETDRLSKLLEQCNIVQNMIDQKLSIYF